MVKVWSLQTRSSIPNACTDFDEELCNEWNERMAKGVFRYPFKRPEKERIISGAKYDFIAQLNTLRSTNRRSPQSMSSVDAPFNPKLFHFGKINEEEEVLFEIRNGDGGSHRLIINASPFEKCHSLLIPDIFSLLPQRLTLNAITLAIQLHFSSGHEGLRLAFNSLCAYASVNHCHWHAYYLETEPQYIQRCALVNLHGGFIWGFQDYSAPGFIFLISKGDEISTVSKNVFALTDFFVKKEIAHNVMMVKGTDASLRIIVWARNSVMGGKNPGAFGIAVCELGGQILIYEESKYETITEDEIVKAHGEAIGGCFEMVMDELKNIAFQVGL